MIYGSICSDTEKPLAIDLFCGLFQTQFGRRADFAVKQLVAGWTENPNHVGLGIARQAPSAVAFEFRTVRDFKDAILSASLTSFGHFWVSTSKAVEGDILKFPLVLVDWAALFVFPSSPYSPQFPSRFYRARRGTISLVRVGRFYRKVIAATWTIPAALGCAFVFIPADASGPLCAIVAAPLLVGAHSLEGCAALAAKQIIHSWVITT